MITYERFWHRRDDGSVHVLGYGQLCAYGRGPDLFQLVAPFTAAHNGDRCRSPTQSALPAVRRASLALPSGRTTWRICKANWRF